MAASSRTHRSGRDSITQIPQLLFKRARNSKKKGKRKKFRLSRMLLPHA